MAARKKVSLSSKLVVSCASKLGLSKQAPPKAREGNKHGRTTGLLVIHCVNALLEANRKAQAPDPELQAWLAGEYPKRSTLQAISAYRSYYNAAKHGLGGPGLKSESYGRLTAEAREKHVRHIARPVAETSKPKPTSKPKAKRSTTSKPKPTSKPKAKRTASGGPKRKLAKAS